MATNRWDSLKGLATGMLLAGVMAALPLGADAQARCPAGGTGCNVDNAHTQIRDRVQEGASRVIRNDNVNGRVNEVQDTLEYCVDCGMDAIRDGADRIGGSRRSTGDTGGVR